MQELAAIKVQRNTMYVWDMPRYSPTEAGRIVQLSKGRVTRWLVGYEYELEGGRAKQKPVLSRDSDSSYASFLDLIDLLFVKRFLDFGFSLQKIRKALAEAEKINGGHHFAQRSFMTDGREIFLWVKNNNSKDLIQLFTGGQWVISDFIVDLAKQIDFDEETGFAEKWFPNGKDGRVVLDPRISFGAPTIVGKGVRTSNIYDFFIAEKESLERTGQWHGITENDVAAAVEFEVALAA